MFKVSMEAHLEEALRKTSPGNMERTKQALLNQMLADMNNYVPLQDGGLRGSGHISGDDLVWRTPYARAQYYGIKRRGFVSDKQRRWFFWALKQGFIAKGYTTAGTGPQWDAVAKGVHGGDWTRLWTQEAGFK